MKRQLNTLGAAVLAGLVLTTNALAQAPGNGGGGFGGRGGQGGQGGQGGFAARMATGAVTSVDANAGTVTITSRFTGQPQIVKVAPATPIATQTAVPISDLKVGDSVQITGVPMAISFTQLTVGDLPAGFTAARNGNQNGGQGGANAAPAAPATPPVQAYAMATGKVTAVTPVLTIALGKSATGVDVTLTLTAASDAKISRITTQTLEGIKVGDQVASMGQTAADGTFTATAMAVNWPQAAGGAGAGGGRGAFGAGGRGAFGAGGQGGFGGGGQGGGQGGRGGRGRRGGQGGGQQGGGNQGQAGAGANIQ